MVLCFFFLYIFHYTERIFHSCKYRNINVELWEKKQQQRGFCGINFLYLYTIYMLYKWKQKINISLTFLKRTLKVKKKKHYFGKLINSTNALSFTLDLNAFESRSRNNRTNISSFEFNLKIPQRNSLLTVMRNQKEFWVFVGKEREWVKNLWYFFVPAPTISNLKVLLLKI